MSGGGGQRGGRHRGGGLRASLRVGGGGGGHDRRGVLILGADLTTGVGLVIGEDLEIDGYLSRGGTRAMMVRSTSGDSAAIWRVPILSTDEAAGAKVSLLLARWLRGCRA